MSHSRMDEDEWEVEKILDKSVSKYGRILYLVKWKNFNEAASSWEPVENLCCPTLIAQFEKELEKLNESEAKAATAKVSKMAVISSGSVTSTERPKPTKTPPPAQPGHKRENAADLAKNKHQKLESRNEIVPVNRVQSASYRPEEESLRRAEAKFDEGFIPERIVGAINIQDSIRFLIKWKDRLECDLVESKTARVKCPQLMLDFYEKNIQWT